MDYLPKLLPDTGIFRSTSSSTGHSGSVQPLLHWRSHYSKKQLIITVPVFPGVYANCDFLGFKRAVRKLGETECKTQRFGGLEEVDDRGGFLVECGEAKTLLRLDGSFSRISYSLPVDVKTLPHSL